MTISFPESAESVKPKEFHKVNIPLDCNNEVSLHSQIDDKVFLQTLRESYNYHRGETIITIPSLIETGCQKAYMRKLVARKLNHGPLYTVTIVKSLF